MTYRYVKQSGMGLRYDIISSSGRRIAIAHNEGDAARVTCALNRQAEDVEICFCRAGYARIAVIHACALLDELEQTK